MGGHHIFVPEQRGTRHSSTELQRRARGCMSHTLDFSRCPLRSFWSGARTARVNTCRTPKRARSARKVHRRTKSQCLSLLFQSFKYSRWGFPIPVYMEYARKIFPKLKDDEKMPAPTRVDMDNCRNISVTLVTCPLIEHAKNGNAYCAYWPGQRMPMGLRCKQNTEISTGVENKRKVGNTAEISTAAVQANLKVRAFIQISASNRSISREFPRPAIQANLKVRAFIKISASKRSISREFSRPTLPKQRHPFLASTACKPEAHPPLPASTSPSRPSTSTPHGPHSCRPRSISASTPPSPHCPYSRVPAHLNPQIGRQPHSGRRLRRQRSRGSGRVAGRAPRRLPRPKQGAEPAAGEAAAATRGAARGTLGPGRRRHGTSHHDGHRPSSRHARPMPAPRPRQCPVTPGGTGHWRGRGAGMARTIGKFWLGWRGHGAGWRRLHFDMSGAGVVRAWRGHVLLPQGGGHLACT
eukprot:gene16906-biopygen23308